MYIAFCSDWNFSSDWFLSYETVSWGLTERSKLFDNVRAGLQNETTKVTVIGKNCSKS